MDEYQARVVLSELCQFDYPTVMITKNTNHACLVPSLRIDACGCHMPSLARMQTSPRHSWALGTTAVVLPSSPLNYPTIHHFPPEAFASVFAVSHFVDQPFKPSFSHGSRELIVDH